MGRQKKKTKMASSRVLARCVCALLGVAISQAVTTPAKLSHQTRILRSPRSLRVASWPRMSEESAPTEPEPATEPEPEQPTSSGRYDVSKLNNPEGAGFNQFDPVLTLS